MVLSDEQGSAVIFDYLSIFFVRLDRWSRNDIHPKDMRILHI